MNHEHQQQLDNVTRQIMKDYDADAFQAAQIAYWNPDAVKQAEAAAPYHAAIDAEMQRVKGMA